LTRERDELRMSEVWNADVPFRNDRNGEYFKGSAGNLSPAMPQMPRPLASAAWKSGAWKYATLPALLSPGTDHLESAILSPRRWIVLMLRLARRYRCAACPLPISQVSGRARKSIPGGSSRGAQKAETQFPSSGRLQLSACRSQSCSPIADARFAHCEARPPHTPVGIELTRTVQSSSSSMRDKKWFPSDPSISSFSVRHARSEHGIRNERDVSPLLPAAGLADCDQCSGARPLSIPIEACFSMRPFTPAATADLSIRLPAGSTLLACIFETIPKICVQPVRSHAPAPSRLLSPRGAFNASNPLPDPILKLPACL